MPSSRKDFKFSSPNKMTDEIPAHLPQGNTKRRDRPALDSSNIAFEIAAKVAYRQTFPKKDLKLPEPIMIILEVTPEDHVRDLYVKLRRAVALFKGRILVLKAPTSRHERL